MPTIIGLTGHVLPKFTDQGICAGMDEVMPKPIYADVLKNLLVKYRVLS